jgi:uncharacterized membrane protein YedE/YeeE
MIGAIAVHSIFYRLIRNRPSPLFSQVFSLPTRTDIDPGLLLGAAIFGTGWGIAGFCPGPAITSILSGNLPPVIFSVAMIAGMFLYKFVEFLRLRRAHAARLGGGIPVDVQKAPE